METLSFILGIAFVVVIALAIVAVYAVVKVSKVSKELEQTQQSFYRDIDLINRNINDGDQSLYRHINDVEKIVYSHVDSRFDKLVTNLQKQKALI